MTMTQGWCWEIPGGPGDLQLKSVELAPLGDHDVLIENRAIAFNPVDWKLMLHGHSDWQRGQIPGVDGMGVIAAVGKAVHHLKDV